LKSAYWFKRSTVEPIANDATTTVRPVPSQNQPLAIPPLGGTVSSLGRFGAGAGDSDAPFFLSVTIVTSPARTSTVCLSGRSSIGGSTVGGPTVTQRSSAPVAGEPSTTTSHCEHFTRRIPTRSANLLCAARTAAASDLLVGPRAERFTRAMPRTGSSASIA